jgi:hypothetical protein
MNNHTLVRPRAKTWPGTKITVAAGLFKPSIGLEICFLDYKWRVNFGKNHCSRLRGIPGGMKFAKKSPQGNALRA